MRKSTLLLIVDMQFDFCHPAGTLYIKGAVEDVKRISEFITTHTEMIDHIVMTQDYHHVVDISHAVFWEDQKGNFPEVFTEINSEAVNKGKWKPRFEKEWAVEYIRRLEVQGEYPHTIWPEHCIIGSHGAAIPDEIMEPVIAWARKGRFYDLVTKGTNPLTEHFGVLMANVPVDGHPETGLNYKLAETLKSYDTILIAGEAKSHCVATSVKQMLSLGGFSDKLVILEDCMSDITGFENLALPIWDKASREGVRFDLSTSWTP